MVLAWCMHMGGAAASQSLNKQRRLQSLQAHTVPLSKAHLAYLNRLAPLYHCQSHVAHSRCVLPLANKVVYGPDKGATFGEFTCGSSNAQPVQKTSQTAQPTQNQHRLTKSEMAEKEDEEAPLLHPYPVSASCTGMLRYECISPAYRITPGPGTIGPLQFYNRPELR